MQQKKNNAMAGEQVYTAPAATPWHCAITVHAAAQAQDAVYTFTVTGQDPLTHTTKTIAYRVAAITHAAYLDLFEKLAIDFKLRLPRNRTQTIQAAQAIHYREVLRENLAAGMFYGYGDPAVIRTGQKEDTCYYLLATSNDAPDSFPVIRSENLKDWTFVNYIFPTGKKPAWAADGALASDYWAPEMHKAGNEYRVYFVARDKHTCELCIGVATAPHPEGPFATTEAPVLRGNVIDPHIFVADEHTTYLFWKEDNNDVWPGALLNLLHKKPAFITQLFPGAEDQLTASFLITLWPWLQKLAPMERFFMTQVFIEAVTARFNAFYQLLETLAVHESPEVSSAIRAVLDYMKTPVFMQQLSADGLTLTGQRTKVMENDLEWEAHLVEGIWLTQYNNRYFLFYAGNDFSTDQYGIGVAVADALTGPYRKMAAPFLRSTQKWWAPGHPSVTTGPDGKPVMFLHAYFPGEAGYKQFRALLSVPLRFEGDQVFVAAEDC